MKLASTFFYLLIGYLLGAWLSSVQISANLAQTDWANIWVYAWMFLWPFFLVAMFFYYAIIIGVVCAGLFWIYTKITDR